MPAVQKWNKWRSLAHIERANAFWRMELVAGQGEKINLIALHVDWHLAHGLHCICVEKDAALLSHDRHLLHRKDDPGLVVGPHD